MKLYFIIMIFFLFFFSYSPLKAQDALSAGNYMVGGGIDFSFSNSKDDTAANERQNIYFRISPAIGKLIKDDLMIGTSFSVAQRSFIREGMRYLNNDLGITIFLRKFWSLDDNFNIYLNPYFGYGRANRTVTTVYAGSTVYRNTESEQTQNAFRLGASFGAFYFISDRFSISASVGNLYFYYASTSNNSTVRSTQRTDNSTRNFTQQGANFIVANSLSSIGINYFF